MTDPFWSIHLGRWAGGRVRLHFLFIAFVFFQLLLSLVAPAGVKSQLDIGTRFASTGAWLILLLFALALHELGHAFVARRVDLPPEDLLLWPLGNLSRPATPSARSAEALVAGMAGPLTSLALVVVVGSAFAFTEVRLIWNPFGGPAGGAPLKADGSPVPLFSLAWWLGWFWYLNYVVFLANLIPALPLDGGRVLRAVLASPRVGMARDAMFEPWTARTCAAVLAAVGVVRLVLGVIAGGDAARPDLPSPIAGPLALLALAGVIEWMVRAESRMIDDDGYFEDGVFDFDYLDGHVGPDVGAAKVQPRQRRESALRRWRRKRAERRRLRLEAREAADALRMDTILEKLHTEGRAGISDEDHRFLIRMSLKIRKTRQARPKPSPRRDRDEHDDPEDDES